LLSRLFTRQFISGFVVVIVLAANGAALQNPPAPLRLLDLTGQEIDPLQTSGSKAVVFLFVRTDCPISNGYAPEVRRLNQKFAARGVGFRLVYTDPDESVAMIRQHVKAYEYHLEVLRDPRHALVKLAGVRVTPEAAVFVNGRQVYRGRIDNRFVAFGKTRPAPTIHDLEAALNAILQGKPVASETTTAIGCYIPEP
jgi:hypothetical protein